MESRFFHSSDHTIGKKEVFSFSKKWNFHGTAVGCAEHNVNEEKEIDS